MSSPPVDPTAVPPTEVSPRARRRVFTAEYKRQILREADACKKPGELGSLLRREGLYRSHLTKWRVAREQGELAGQGRSRGPTPKPVDPGARRIAELERENAQLERRARRAEAMVELQKKVAAILGSPLLDLNEMP
jgi:transposase-like protein